MEIQDSEFGGGDREWKFCHTDEVYRPMAMAKHLVCLETGRKRGALTLAVTNTSDTPVERASELCLTYATRQECGPCISVVSTRIAMVTMLAIALAKRRGRRESELEGLTQALNHAGDVGKGLIQKEESHIRDLARRWKDAGPFFLVGSGPNYFSAREGTLKIEKQGIIVGKAYRTGDFHNDALSLPGPDKVVVAIEAEGSANSRIVDALRVARQAECPTLAVVWTDSPGASQLAVHADELIQIQGCLPELIIPIPMTIVFQLVGYYLGVERGYNPDTLRTDNWPNARACLTACPLGTH